MEMTDGDGDRSRSPGERCGCGSAGMLKVLKMPCMVWRGELGCGAPFLIRPRLCHFVIFGRESSELCVAAGRLFLT